MSVALALLTSLCYGVSNFVGPRISQDLPLFSVLIAGQIVALVCSGIIGLVGGGFLSAAGAGAALAAGLGNGLGLYAFYRAAATGPLSIVAPIGALGAAVPVIAGAVGGEDLGALRGAGIAMAIAGVALASRRPGGAPIAEPGARPVAWAALAALGFGTFLTCLAPAAASDPIWAVCVSRMSLVAILVAVALGGSSALRVPARALPRVAVPGVLLFAGTLAYSAATTLGDLSVVSVLASCNPVVTVGLAFLLLRERLSPGQGVGVVLALAGVILVSAR